MEFIAGRYPTLLPSHDVLLASVAVLVIPASGFHFKNTGWHILPTVGRFNDVPSFPWIPSRLTAPIQLFLHDRRRSLSLWNEDNQCIHCRELVTLHLGFREFFE